MKSPTGKKSFYRLRHIFPPSRRKTPSRFAQIEPMKRAALARSDEERIQEGAGIASTGYRSQPRSRSTPRLPRQASKQPISGFDSFSAGIGRL